MGPGGDIHVRFAATARAADTHITLIKPAHSRDGDTYIINGRKVFTTKAREASRMLLLTRTTPFEQVTKKTDGMSLFFAELDPSAVEIRELEKLGRAAVDTNLLFIDNLKVSASDLIGGEARGFHCLLDGLNPQPLLLRPDAIRIAPPPLTTPLTNPN